MIKRLAKMSLILVSGTWLIGCAGSPAEGALTKLSLAMFAGVEKSSPTQTAVGLKANLPLAQSDAGTLLGIGGVQRQWFDGGHDNVFTVGLQGRRPLSGSGAWIGAEGTYNNWRVSGGQNAVANVFGFSGLAGRPIGAGPLHVWGSAGLLFFGDFQSDGALVFEGGTGWQFNVGVELRTR